MPPREGCPACGVAVQAEERAITKLARLPSEGTGRKSLESRNFCLEHLHGLLLDLRDTKVGTRLLVRHNENLARVAENMQRHALQFDGRRRDLMTEEEAQAPRQGLIMLVGHPNAQHSQTRKLKRPA